MFVLIGIVLLVAGAILTFAVEASADGVDIAAIGWILMAGGVVALAAAAFRAAAWESRAHSRMHVEKHMSADGRHVTEDVQTN